MANVVSDLLIVISNTSQNVLSENVSQNAMECYENLRDNRIKQEGTEDVITLSNLKSPEDVIEALDSDLNEVGFKFPASYSGIRSGNPKGKLPNPEIIYIKEDRTEDTLEVTEDVDSFDSSSERTFLESAISNAKYKFAPTCTSEAIETNIASQNVANSSANESNQLEGALFNPPCFLSCKTCGKELRLGNKLRLLANGNQDKNFCSKSCEIKHSGTAEEAKDLKTVECQLCFKKISRRSGLQRHLRTHSGERPYKCHICMKSFSDSSNLQHHRRIHDGIKPYECDHCKGRFSSIRDLKRHIIIHSGEKPYKCERCQRKFSFLYSLTAHQRTHTEDQPYICEICGMKFKAISSLKRHMKVHAG